MQLLELTDEVYTEDVVFTVGDQEIRSVAEDEHLESLLNIKGPSSSRSDVEASVTNVRTVPPTR